MIGSKSLLVSVQNNVAVLTLNRQSRLNSLGDEMGAQLLHWLKSPPSDVRCIVLTGAGDKAFSTGRDLKDSKSHTPEQAKAYMSLARNTARAWTKLNIPSIAAINGHAFGWGLEMSLACDLRVANTDALLCFPECGLGIFPGALGAVLLPRIVGPAIAKDLILTSRRIKGDEALTLGLVNRVASGSTQTRGIAMELALMIAKNAPLGVKGARQVIDQGLDMTLADHIELSDKHRFPLNDTKDFHEGLEAFEQGRSPRFQGE